LYQSQSDLSGRLRISQQRLSKLLRDPEWRWGRGPWTEDQADEADAWLAGRREANNATAGMDSGGVGDAQQLEELKRNPEKLARLRLIIERTAKVKLERELLAGNYLKREQVAREQVSKVYAVRAKLQELPLRAHLLVGKTEAECEAVLIGWMREVCEFFAGGEGNGEGEEE
jgi:hypothetical protein